LFGPDVSYKPGQTTSVPKDGIANLQQCIGGLDNHPDAIVASTEKQRAKHKVAAWTEFRFVAAIGSTVRFGFLAQRMQHFP
jgi:hypothetical protein